MLLSPQLKSIELTKRQDCPLHQEDEKKACNGNKKALNEKKRLLRFLSK